MDTRTWPCRLACTTLLSATLVALCQAQDAAAPRPRQVTAIPGSANLTTSSFSFPAVLEDTTGGGGFQLYYSSINSGYSDSNLAHEHGIAIIGADTSHGHYEYSVSVASPNWIPVGAVSPTSALLLSLTAGSYTTPSSTYLRFIPNANFDQTASGSLSFVAWDETQFAQGNRVDVSQPNVFGNTIGQAAIPVTGVNDAPVLDISGNPTLNAETYGAANSAGTRIDVMLSRGAGGAPISDVDTGALTGIAVIGADTAYGSWQYTINGPANWTAFPGVSATNALLLNVSAGPYTSGTDVRVRFIPSNPNFTGTITNALTFRAWDQTNFVFAGSQVNPTSGIGGTGSFSVSAETAALSVTGSGPAPVASVVFPEPPVSSGEQTIYGAVCPGTPEGLTSLEAALNGKAPSEARGFAWDSITQLFAEYPVLPRSGLRIDSGVFVATRSPLPVNFAGSISAMPYVLTLQPGWNLVGVPPLDNGGPILLSHPWDNFLLVDDTATPVAGAAQFTAVLGTPAGATSTARPWAWDGVTYAQVTTLVTGQAYWIKNNSSVIYTLQRTSSSQLPNPRIVRAASTHVLRGTITDRGAPPAAPTSRADKPAGGCGAGSAIGMIGIGLAAALRGLGLRRRRD